MFCVSGIAVGTIIGYYMGINMKLPLNCYMHVKAIVCYRYDGLEVYHIQRIPVKFLARRYYLHFRRNCRVCSSWTTLKYQQS